MGQFCPSLCMDHDRSMEAPDPRLGEGIALFNQGDYYACHDVLEAIWMESPTAAGTPSPGRTGSGN